MIPGARWDADVAYSAERKAVILTRTLLPNNVPLARLSKEEGISPGISLAIRHDDSIP